MKKHFKKSVAEGLARIKLIVPIMIISTLAACATSVSEDDIIRNRLAESLISAEVYQDWVVDNATKGLPLNYGVPVFVGTDNTQSIDIYPATGVITIVGSIKAKSIVLFLNPSDINGALVAGTPSTGHISWTCTTAETEEGRVPVECR